MSGPESFAIADRIVALSHGRPPEPWHLRRGSARDPRDGRPIDEVLVVRMPGPRSYTGEDIVEIHCHGSPLVVETVIDAATRVGARLADRGEFTRRAVLNGRMDVLQAEATLDLIDARVTGGARMAWSQLQGALSRRLEKLRAAILSVLADVEAGVDFSDDDPPVENPSARLEAIEGARAAIGEMLDGFPAARRWRDGYRVVFAGRPNAGKSSLVNALLGHGRMIVSEEPGTTRDSVEELVDLRGRAFVLTDTAGVRQTPGVAEAMAVSHTRDRIAEADIVVHVVDCTRGPHDDDLEICNLSKNCSRVVVLNKSDRPRSVGLDYAMLLAGDGRPVVETCALTGDGCDALAEALVSATDAAFAGDEPPVAVSRIRHRSSLERAAQALRVVRELLAGDLATEIVALELRTALQELANITDPVDNEDVLDRIFSEFCIGK
jgi:tRNA modification GTPase